MGTAPLGDLEQRDDRHRGDVKAACGEADVRAAQDLDGVPQQAEKVHRVAYRRHAVRALSVLHATPQHVTQRSTPQRRPDGACGCRMTTPDPIERIVRFGSELSQRRPTYLINRSLQGSTALVARLPVAWRCRRAAAEAQKETGPINGSWYRGACGESAGFHHTDRDDICRCRRSWCSGAPRGQPTLSLPRPTPPTQRQCAAASRAGGMQATLCAGAPPR